MDGTDRRRTAFSIYIGVVQSRIQYVIKYTIDTNIPVEPVVPDYPFQHVCADYLSLNGESYGVYVNR